MENRLKKQNFTLTEMMVVIAIIVILCMLLFPGFNAVREQAKRTQCMSRVREVAQLGAKYSADNDGQVCISGYYLDGESNSVQLSDWSKRMMASVRPEAIGKRDPHWWMFICTNVLPYWNNGASMNAKGYTKGQKNAILEPVWQKIKPGRQGDSGDIGQIIGDSENGTQDAVYAFGNFGVNKNGDIVSRVVKDKSGITRGVQILHMSQIKSPGKRAFIVEEGEATNQDNGTHDVQYVEYKEPLSRGRTGDKGSATGYIPGIGGGGIGKEKMEKIGYDHTISEDELDSERLELVKKDVMEGRHMGVTLHGFFDGHAEAIPVETVGALQRGPNDSAGDLKGPYGKITEAADDE